MNALFVAALALLPAAEAAENQIDLSFGSQTTNDDGWEVVGDGYAHQDIGGRVGVALGEHLSILGSYRYGAGGNTVYNDEWEEDTNAPGDEFLAASYLHALTVGPKLSGRVNRFFSAYGTAQLSGHLATIRVDADPILDDDATQLQERGLAPGILGAAGLEANLPFNQRSWTPAAYLEMGYGHTLAMKFDTFGEMNFSGFYASWGVGVRF